MLGPSIIAAGTPFAFGYSLFAPARTTRLGLTYPAIIISALEVIAILYIIIDGLISMARNS